MKIRRILIAVDGRPVSVQAAEVGIELASSLGAEIAFVHAIEPGLVQATGVTPAELLAEAESEARSLMDGFCRLVPQTHQPLEFVHVGKPAHEIVRTAKEWPADLIVIGSHGRHGIKRALLGSVADGVMWHAPCPVLVIRARE